MNQAYGFLEVRGLVCGIEAADAMLKAASVRLVRQITISPGLITLVLEGDIGSCRAAVDAGCRVAERHEALVSEKVIGRPASDLALLLKPPRTRKKT
ncbi:MAG: BMC domain-containing protein [Rhodoferax sp.]|nr:BMC domain-containing protein [Rhodoferax sp.]